MSVTRYGIMVTLTETNSAQLRCITVILQHLAEEFFAEWADRDNSEMTEEESLMMAAYFNIMVDLDVPGYEVS